MASSLWHEGASLDLRIGRIAFGPLFLVALTPSTIRAREAAVQDSENSVYKMHEKDSENSVYKMHEGWEMEDRRWKTRRASRLAQRVGGRLGAYWSIG